MKDIGILDYGVGNIRSVQNMLWKLDIRSTFIRHENDLSKVNKLILPGVGSFDYAAKNLTDRNLYKAIKSFADDGYILGICLGMQLLAESSEEGKLQGLNLIPGKIIRFKSNDISIPHIGWNFVNYKSDTFDFSNNNSNRYYFVHSYHFECENKYIIGETNYGYDFPSVVSNGENVFGAQFHPEKSHRFGKQFLEKFIEI